MGEGGFGEASLVDCFVGKREAVAVFFHENFDAAGDRDGDDGADNGADRAEEAKCVNANRNGG